MKFPGYPISGTFFILIVLIAATCGCTGSDKKLPEKGTEGNPIIMGFNPAEGAESLYINADKMTKELEKLTGYKIKSYVLDSYPALVTAIEHDHVDIAWLPAFAFVQAEQYAQAKIHLKAVRNGQPFYFGSIVVKADSPYQKIEDLEGKTIAWASETSTSGRIFPCAQLMKMGIDPETYFKRSKMAGDHKTALIALINDDVDAAAVFASDEQGTKGAWTQFLSEEDAAKIRPILITQPIPSDTMSSAKKFAEENPELLNKLIDKIKHLTDTEEGQKALKDLYNIDKMIDATSEEYEPVREAARLMDIPIEGPVKKETKPAEEEKESKDESGNKGS
jgi:phosphonate transport system substrate-binding protein